jgi:glycosyltransferase involved in cell wall biosynthesis
VTLLAAHQAAGGQVVSCHEPPPGPQREAIARAPWRLAPALARTHWRLWRRRKELVGVDALLVPYPGHLLMPLARVVANDLGVPLLFDPFLSLFDTVVGDRQLFEGTSLRARAYKRLDSWALALADRVLADTPAMAAYYQHIMGPGAPGVAVVPVGVDERVFCPGPLNHQAPFEVLFVGHMLPLHGISTIVEAAKLLVSDPRVRFHLVGSGPCDVERLILEAGIDNIRWEASVPFERLPALFAGATICLGAFGTSEKAGRVVPHKVFQAAACERVVVTLDGVAVREAFGSQALVLVPAGNARALAGAITELLDDPIARTAHAIKAREIVLARFGHQALARALADALAQGPDGSFAMPAGMS